ncbi:prolipoprotein diacylglyceryl transferase [Balneolales bacterium ANBcel1]|nr:prolipoprotein diacylglyceryl transferase [Balneolales bacterium ANBcel1]
MSSDHFYWEGQPILHQFGEISLPFAFSIPGLILAVIAFLLLPGYLAKYLSGQADDSQSKKRRRKKRKEGASGDPDEELTGWQSFGLFIALLAIGQILFLVLPGPTFEQIGPITVRWYGFLFALAFLTGYFIGRKLFRDAGVDVQLADRLLTYIVVATLLGARLGHVIFYDFDYYIRNIHEVLLLWRGGLASHGATVGILIALWLYIRKYPQITFFWLTDRLSIPVILGGSFIRVGNFMNSEIIGLPSDLPWAVIFAREDLLPRHPTMLYEALICIVILVVLVALYYYFRKKPPEGLLTGVFMILLFTSRFFIEYTKVEQAAFTETWMVGMGQLLSIPFILFGIWVLWKKVQWPTSGTIPPKE